MTGWCNAACNRTPLSQVAFSMSKAPIGTTVQPDEVTPAARPIPQVDC
jgi:hypothetical protein